MKLVKKNDEANKLLFEFKKIDEILDNAELVCTKTDGTKYDFNCFSLPLKFIEKIYNHKIILNEAIDNQAELKILINNLNNNYNPRNIKKAKEKNRVLESAKKNCLIQEILLVFLKKELFRIKIMYLKQKKKKN